MATLDQIAQRFALPMSQLPIPAGPTLAPTARVVTNTAGCIDYYIQHLSPTLSTSMPRARGRLVTYGSAESDNMHIVTADRPTLLRASEASGRVFEPLVIGYSYRTPVAMLVRNCSVAHIAGGYELWLTSSRFSVTTNRHVGMYRSAFARAFMVCAQHCGMPGLSPYDRIFSMGFVSMSYPHAGSATHRADPRRDDITDVLRVADELVRKADTPRLQSSTRESYIVQAQKRLQELRDQLTLWIPETYTAEHRNAATQQFLELEALRARIVGGLDDRLGFIALLRSVSIEEARVLIRADLELRA